MAIHLHKGMTLGTDEGSALFVVLGPGHSDGLPPLDGQPMGLRQAPWCGAPHAHDQHFQVGQVFIDEQSRLTLRCTRAGAGQTLHLDGRALRRSPQADPRPPTAFSARPA